MSDPLRDVERAIERLGRRLVTGGEDLPEEVVVPAADLAALLAEVARLRAALAETGVLAAESKPWWTEPRDASGFVLTVVAPESAPPTAPEALGGMALRPRDAEPVRGPDGTTEAPGRREGEPGAEEG